MNTYYRQLMEYKGAQELQEHVRRWEILSENLSRRFLDAPIVLPDLFMYTPRGYGNTNLLSLMAEYLSSKGNLMSFYGDVKFFEFRFEYCPEGRDFREIYRFIEAVNNAAGFRNEFKGIIRISVDEWVGHHKEDNFLDFLEFLQLNTDYWMIILTVSDEKENEETKAMEAVISMYLRLETVALHMQTDEELADFAVGHFEKYGLKLDEGAKKVIEGSIAELKKNKYFGGLRTVQSLCNDIVYSVYSESTDISRVITADMLSDFGPDSEYIKRTFTRIKTARLGF